MADLPPAAVATLPRRRFGVDADARELQVVGAVVHQPRDAAGDDQLGHADHRPARPRARAGHQLLELVWVILAYMIASTVLVLTAGRLSDLFGRKNAYVGGFVVFAARLARRRLRRQRHRADPLAHRPGHRRRLPLRQRRRAGHRRLPARAARPGDGDQHDGRRGRARDRPGPRRRARRRSPGTGSSGSTCRSALAGALWGGLVLHELARKRHASAASTCCGTAHLRRRPDRARARDLQGRHLRLERPARHRRPRRRRRPAAALRADRAPRPGADARPDDLPEPAVRRRHRRRLHQRPVALRAAVRLRLLLPGRAGRRPDHRRHQARADGDRDARRLAARRASGPTATARARWRRWGWSVTRRRRWPG